jgi:hypothetical protein
MKHAATMPAAASVGMSAKSSMSRGAPASRVVASFPPSQYPSASATSVIERMPVQMYRLTPK